MRKFGRILAGAAGALAAVAGAQSVHAAINANGSAAISIQATGTVALNGNTPANSQILAVNVSKNEGPLVTGAITGNLALAPGFATGVIPVPSSFMIPIQTGAIPTFTLTIGPLTFQFTSETPLAVTQAQSTTQGGSFSFELTGTLTADSSGTFNTGQSASLSESCSQAAGALPVVINCSNTLATPASPIGTPEPTSLALLGSGLAGLGLLWRRRRKTA